MKRLVNRVLIAVGIAVLAIASASAMPITRAQFGLGAMNFDFGPANAPTLTDGFLTVTQALINNVDSNDFVSSNAIDNGSGGGIRLNFTTPISAVGMDFFTNNANVTLSVFDATNTLIESLLIPFGALPIGSPFSFPYGFIGLMLLIMTLGCGQTRFDRCPPRSRDLR